MKNMLVKLDHFLKSGWTLKIMKPPPSHDIFFLFGFTSFCGFQICQVSGQARLLPCGLEGFCLHLQKPKEGKAAWCHTHKLSKGCSENYSRHWITNLNNATIKGNPWKLPYIPYICSVWPHQDGMGNLKIPLLQYAQNPQESANIGKYMHGVILSKCWHTIGETGKPFLFPNTMEV